MSRSKQDLPHLNSKFDSDHSASGGYEAYSSGQNLFAKGKTPKQALKNLSVIFDQIVFIPAAKERELINRSINSR